NNCYAKAYRLSATTLVPNSAGDVIMNTIHQPEGKKMYGHTWRPQRGGVRGGGGWGSESARALERIERAVVKSQTDILAKGENVSAWKVSQAALLTLQAYSWDSLGFPMQQVPSLFRIMVIEGKVNSFIHCFVGVQRITTLYDLEVAICDSEGVRRFEELELGPLLQHPLVQHYFSVGSDVAEVFKITTQEVISYLGLLIWRNKNITPDDLLDFISKRKKQVKETLCLRIQSLGYAYYFPIVLLFSFLEVDFMKQRHYSEDSLIKSFYDLTKGY
ncbi:hypothetical protein MIMGU_mgv11b015863mg, partial [Erythranthe guttata]